MKQMPRLALSCATIFSVGACAANAALPGVVLTERKITASDAEDSDAFGTRVAIDGTLAIVGAYADDDAETDSGSAYLFDSVNGAELLKLTASDAAFGDQFGYSVGTDGNVAIVGANEDDDGGDRTGSAYLFDVRTGQQINKLTADDPDVLAMFGSSVDVSGDTAIVGAPLNNEKGTWAGAAYLFDVPTGQQKFKLIGSDLTQGDFFGAVAIHGHRAIVGAHQANSSGAEQGAAYLFDAATGAQLAKLSPPTQTFSRDFGLYVGLDDQRAIVGDPANFDAGVDAGAAYIFDFSGNLVTRLIPNDADPGDLFGTSVSISGALAIVGAEGDDEFGSRAGAAYLFDVATGAQIAKLNPSGDAGGNRYGWSVAIDGNRAIVAAVWDSTIAPRAGAAYLYELVPEPATQLLAIVGLSAATLRFRKEGR